MPKYNHGYEEVDGELYEHWTDRSGHEHTYIQISSDDEYDDDDDDMGDGCRACGNPAYPDCMSSCPLCDD